MKKIFSLFFTLVFAGASFAGTITSTTTGGNWSAASTWVGSVAPAAGDDVIIANGATVTIDASVNCTSLTVGQGTSGILQYNTTSSARTLTVSGNMIINAGGIVKPGASGGFANVLTIAGNLTNNGTLTTAITTNYINLVFNGTVTSQTFANTGTITSNELRSLTINNTAGSVTIPSALSIASGATLTLTAGTLLVGAGGTGSITLGSAASGTFTCVRTNGSMVAATATFGAGVTTKTYTYNGTGTITTGIELTAAASITINVLSINNSALNLILNKAINVNAALTLTNGIVNTSATNLLSLGTATAAGILTGGSATAFINGPFARTFGARASSATYNATTLFPVGKGGLYLPLYLAPTTTAAGVQLTAEAFTTNTGTNIAPSGTLSTNRWESFVVAGAANLVQLYIQENDAAIAASNIILKSTAAAGVYKSIAPSSTFATATPNTLKTTTEMTAAEYAASGYFAYGDGCYTNGFFNISSPSVCLYTPITLNTGTYTGTWVSSIPANISVTSPAGIATGLISGSSSKLTFTITTAGVCNGVPLDTTLRVTNCAGGVAGATLWIRGQDATSTTWTNSGTTAVNLSGVNSPAQHTAGINYNQTAFFNGTNQLYNTTSSNYGLQGANDYDHFMVMKPSDMLNKVYYLQGPNTIKDIVMFTNPIGLIGGLGTNFVNTGSLRSPGALYPQAGIPFITTVSRLNNVPATGFYTVPSNFSMGFNGASVTCTPTQLIASDRTGTTTAQTSVGGGGGSYFGGDIGEVVLFQPHLSNATDILKVNSYLALKYGITLDNSAGGAAGNYVLSDGTTACTASVNPGWHHQVIGIVRDDASALLQKQSHTQDDSLRLFLSTLAATNQANTGNISVDKSALMIGNDGGSPHWSSAVSKPATIASRLVRTFKVTNTNFTNSFSIEIKCDSIGGLYSLSSLRFLVSTTTDFSSAVEYMSPDVTFAFGSIIVNGISNSIVPANSTRYVTVGLTLVILPIELTAFTADAVDNKKVNLNWQTAAVTSNDYFTVQKSGNGNQWMDVEKVKAENFISTTRAYKVVDNKPIKGISYYRLYHPGINGEQRYSPIRTVHIYTNTLLVVYPNPSSGNITIEGTAAELSQLKLFSVTGQDVSGQIQVINRNSSKIVVDLSQLSKGIYMMKTNTTVTKLFKQ
jgi:hypothetical protein